MEEKKKHRLRFHSTDVQGGSGDGYYYCLDCGKSFDDYDTDSECKEK
jgi:hypothetical protein